MKPLALIPARGGSVRVSRKNIRPLGGRPLICHTIECAQLSGVFDRIIVSTDDAEIASIAKKAGAEVPFLRPEALANSQASDKDVMIHALQELGVTPRSIFYLRPTAPFRTPEMIQEGFKQLSQNEALTGLRSITATTGVHHPFWSYRIEGATLVPFVEGTKIEKYYQSQALPPCYRLNGVVDIIRPENLQSDSIYGSRPGYLLLEAERAVDIDTPLDFKWCEFLYEEFKKVKRKELD